MPIASQPRIKYDLRKIEERMLLVSKLAHKNGIKILFPVKAFPAKPVLALAGKILDGFDISNNTEFALIKSVIKKDASLWISGPGREVPPGQIAKRAVYSSNSLNA